MINHIFDKMYLSAKDLYSALAHETRLRCVMLLMQYEELCVCELTHALGVSQPHISRHLGLLRGLGLLADRREGLWIHYRITPHLPDWVMAVLEHTLHGVADEPPFATDVDALSEVPNSAGAPRCA